jgi:hypothetical protein
MDLHSICYGCRMHAATGSVYHHASVLERGPLSMARMQRHRALLQIAVTSIIFGLPAAWRFLTMTAA